MISDVRSMHIEVQQGIQHIAANRSRKFLPEEIDWVLNKMVERFIQSCLKPRTLEGRPTGAFEVDQLKADAIRMLLVRGKPLKAYIHDDNTYKCILPGDYKYLVSDAALTTNLCGTLPIPNSETLYVGRLRQAISIRTTPPFYLTVQATIGNKIVLVPTDIPYGHSYTGYPEKGDRDFLKEFILSQTEWWWERFDDLYYPECYIGLMPSASTAPTLAQDGSTTAGNLHIKTYTYHGGNGQMRPNRLVPSELRHNLMATPYWKTMYSSPLSELAGNILYIYRDRSFTVNGAEVTYVRKPRPISLSLNTDCELAPDFHQTICDLAVEYLKGTTENVQGFQVKQTDIQNRVIL